MFKHENVQVKFFRLSNEKKVIMTFNDANWFKHHYKQDNYDKKSVNQTPTNDQNQVPLKSL